MNDGRLDPDKLLKQLQENEINAREGKLRIFIGAAPGVGKTYAMLEDAIEKKSNGIDVIIGIVESHGRKDIIKFIDKLETLPLQAIQYRGKEMYEFNIDDAIKRRPQLILMDEMAHTNAPGLRHAKRWQDIRELLDNQIDVYTTLNVQHIESLNDRVSGIIHTSVRETVPDMMLEIADSIELIDLPTEDLLKRLAEGKIYIPARAKIAAEHFFLPGNLIALREMALRVTAARVGKQVDEYREEKGIRHVWSSHEKILVCVGSSGVKSLQLIRRGKQLASLLQTKWIVAHVNAASKPENEEQRKTAINNLRLAEQLGAETIELSGIRVSETLIQYARDQNISLIMISKDTNETFKNIFLGSIADDIIKDSGEIDVYVITSTPSQINLTTPSKSWTIKAKFLLKAFLLTSGATVFNYFFNSIINSSQQIILYLLLISLLIPFTNFITGFCIVCIVIAQYLILPNNRWPNLSLNNIGDLLYMCVVTLITAKSIYTIIVNRRVTELARTASWHSSVLYRLNRLLSGTHAEPKIISESEYFLSETINCLVKIYTTHSGNLSNISTIQELSRDEFKAIEWVSRMGQRAGIGTDTLTNSDALYLPLSTSQGILGVMSIKPKNRTQPFLPEQIRLLESCAGQIALTIEVNQLNEEAWQTELRSTLERDRLSFMQSIARDLLPPINAILTYAKIIETQTKVGEPNKNIKSAQIIFQEANKIHLISDNLLQTTWMDFGSLQPNRASIKLDSIIKKIISEYFQFDANFIVDGPDQLNNVTVDIEMIKMVLLNLIDNAVRFSPIGESIRVFIRQDESTQSICIENNGPTIPEQEIESIFQKYYQINPTQKQKGLGLGLAICRKIIQAHGGEIWAENRGKKSVAFYFTLPTDTVEKN